MARGGCRTLVGGQKSSSSSLLGSNPLTNRVQYKKKINIIIIHYHIFWEKNKNKNKNIHIVISIFFFLIWGEISLFQISDPAVREELQIRESQWIFLKNLERISDKSEKSHFLWFDLWGFAKNKETSTAWFILLLLLPRR